MTFSFQTFSEIDFSKMRKIKGRNSFAVLAVCRCWNVGGGMTLFNCVLIFLVLFSDVWCHYLTGFQRWSFHHGCSLMFGLAVLVQVLVYSGIFRYILCTDWFLKLMNLAFAPHMVLVSSCAQSFSSLTLRPAVFRLGWENWLEYSVCVEV